MAITAILDLRLKPEAVDRANDVLHATLTATRQFDGCLGVDVVVDTTDATHILLIERWASPEHDAAYRAWRATPEGKSELGTLLAGPPSAALYTLADGV
jgi:quinol monooxygenase YgiN